MAATALPNLSTPVRASTERAPSVSDDTPCPRSSGSGSVGEQRSDLGLRLEEALQGRITSDLPIPTGLSGSQVEQVVKRSLEAGLSGSGCIRRRSWWTSEL